MPISVCQESVQDVFSHTVQVVIRGISLSPRSLCQALGASFKPSSESGRGFVWPKRQLPLKSVIFHCLPLRVVPAPVLLQRSLLSSTERVVLCGGWDILVWRDSQSGNILRQSRLSSSQYRNRRRQPCRGKRWLSWASQTQLSSPAGEPAKGAVPWNPVQRVWLVGC